MEENMGLSSNILHDKVCVVTGAAKSIGLAIARKFAEQGAVTAMIDIDPAVMVSAGELADKGYIAKGFVQDITNRDEVIALFADITGKMGDVFCLVNNAGVVDQRPFEETRAEHFDLMYRVNVYGSAWCIQGALPGMKKNKSGKIINFSSKSGKTGSALMVPYSSAKGAVIAMTQALAYELAPFNINVNCVCPGITDDTGVWDSVSEGYIGNLKMEREEVVKQFAAKIPLKRLTSIDEIVEYVFFLAASGDYCTGQALNITGGREMH